MSNHTMDGQKRVRYLAVVALAGVAFFGAYAYALAARGPVPSQVGADPYGAIFPAAAGPAAGGGGCSSCGSCSGGNPTGEPIVGTAVVEGGVQRLTVDVTKGYYDPDTIVLVAGVPAEITFTESSGCTAQVMSKSLGFFEDLTTGPKTVKLPALEPGEYGYSCGMEMLFGKFVVEAVQ